MKKPMWEQEKNPKVPWKEWGTRGCPSPQLFGGRDYLPSTCLPSQRIAMKLIVGPKFSFLWVGFPFHYKMVITPVKHVGRFYLYLLFWCILRTFTKWLLLLIHVLLIHVLFINIDISAYPSVCLGTWRCLAYLQSSAVSWGLVERVRPCLPILWGVSFLTFPKSLVIWCESSSRTRCPGGGQN